MDYQVLQTALWGGFGIGMAIMAGATAVMLPAAYAMNRFIYHAWPMRLLLGLMAGLGFIVSAPIVMIRTFFGWDTQPLHYFGLLPLFAKPGWAENFSGFTAMPFKLLYILLEPFMMASANESDDNFAIDKKGFEACLSHLVISPDDAAKEKSYEFEPGSILTVHPNAVCEGLFDLIRETGVIRDHRTWVEAVDRLSGACNYMFGFLKSPPGGQGSGDAGGRPPSPPPPPPGEQGSGDAGGPPAGGPPAGGPPAEAS